MGDHDLAEAATAVDKVTHADVVQAAELRSDVEAPENALRAIGHVVVSRRRIVGHEANLVAGLRLGDTQDGSGVVGMDAVAEVEGPQGP